ncbi:DNA/RNA helicase domain-containing protein [Homoserinibacter sp. YIM 151385]|uniref:DNA/RNA helicase domain-containing protein n=1 Tax=Homoserinibacter sp. YIM 151385 TaxID=2985506 RepID=UPI0022F038B7|nr:DNA/RNA helicase domain-containing protein [Homoserinibacter sp. YIM 151385]WBU37871.1 DUF2075 domain-containing protein [Homoserinibacter sp. YIM 151385]
MTGFEVQRLPFEADAVKVWAAGDRRRVNWPVVYVLDGERPARAGELTDIYVGESLNAAGRMRQHLDSPSKQTLTTMRVILDDRFNKSVCLDLESFLIRMLSGDGAFRVLNRNDGITDSDYYDRETYRQTFLDVFEELRHDGIFTRSVPEIENSDLFKLSPFKALTQDQAIAVEDIVEGVIDDLRDGGSTTMVVQGEPGTGKTVIAIYLLKMLADIAAMREGDEPDADSLFSEFFVSENRDLLAGARVGIVVPQQSLRDSIKKVFRRTPGLSATMVLTPFQVGESPEEFDLLIVDEAHRLNQRANQASGVQNRKFRDINVALFGEDDTSKTQLDWIVAKSRHQILMLDAAQSVRPADLPLEQIQAIVDRARSEHRHYPLVSQLRVNAGPGYIGFVRALLGDPVSAERREAPDLSDYEFALFDDLGEMQDAIRERDARFGLARLVAGYAWPWLTKLDKSAFDIEVDGVSLRWNSTQTDWIASKGSLDEVGSIHTVQGYDLNYAGVIIGRDLRYDRVAGRLFIDRDSYFDKKGKENNPVLGRTYSDDDLLRYITNIYAVLLTRGIRGTFVYACDPGLREYLRERMPRASSVPP